MHSLRYTNILLTVIALCLIYQCVKFGAPPSVAQGAAAQSAAAAPVKPVLVQIAGTPTVKVDGTVKTDTTIVGTPTVDVSNMSAVSGGRIVLPVQVMNPGNSSSSSGQDRPITINTSTPLDVNIVGLRGDLPVEIKNVPLRVDCGMPNAPMPVEVKNAPLSVQLWGIPYPWQVQVTNFPKQ
jgi:hypothetical protein